ncbi:MAG TPA: DUF1800 family protein, partial [Thermoanaerobaculia bacterium]|nr:DUF1800 family protein [Thermoanaerobaculia bacterium]
VEEVARAFTGWRLGKGDPQSIRLDQFLFNPAQHDDGARTVLGTPLPAGLGVGHGERVLDLLASHPACARFIAFKLCRRFVADDPPPALIDRAAATFTATDGDIQAVMRAILLSSEFLAAANRKLKRPFEYLVSALRAVGATLASEAMPGLLETLFRMGQLPFDCAPPTGYPDVAEAWGHTNGLLDRWNFALALGSDRLPGVTPDFEAMTAGLRRPTPTALADHLIARLLARDLDPEDRRQVIRFLAGTAGVSPTAPIPQRKLRSVIGSATSLLLGSPYFQWR